MALSDHVDLNGFIEGVKRRNPGQPEFVQAVTEVAEDPAWSDKLIEPPTVAGVESVGGGTMTLRIFAKTRPGEQYAIPREIRERAKQAFDREGVRGPAVVPFGGPQA